jgi:hypothetical protein
MSLPRRVLPLGVHLVTRRVVGRRFLLRPSKEVNAIVKYAVVRACALMEVVLLGTTWESNHWHAVVYDPRCRLPKFMHAIDTLVARALNAHYGLGGRLLGSGELQQPGALRQRNRHGQADLHPREPSQGRPRRAA